MHYMVPLLFYTHNFVIEEVLHYIKELYKSSHKSIKNTLHSFSHGLIIFCEFPTQAHGRHFEFGQSDHVKYMLQINCQKHVQLPQPKFHNKEIAIGPLIN